jgi:hypothetical protein
MRKNLSELNFEEAKALFNINQWAKERGQEYANDNADFWIEEVLDYFRKCRALDYCIGYPGNYFTFIDSRAGYDDFQELFKAYRAITKDMCVISENVFAKVERAAARLDFYLEARNGYEDISDAKYEMLEKWILSIIEEANDDILKYLEADDDSRYNDDFIFECFFDHLEDMDDYETDGVKVYETFCREYA